MKYIVEIGANIGSDTKGLLQDPDAQVFAFEPHPDLYQNLCTMFANDSRIQIFPFAVDLLDGEREFHISDYNNGLGSLYEFHPELLNTALQKYPDFKAGFARTTVVKTVRLDTWMHQHNIPHIDYIWIDAQGNDLNCLKSAGVRLKDIHSGRMEVTYKVPIYTKTENDFDTAKTFLENVGFSVAIEYVHENDSEIDIKFWRP